MRGLFWSDNQSAKASRRQDEVDTRAGRGDREIDVHHRLILVPGSITDGDHQVDGTLPAGRE